MDFDVTTAGALILLILNIGMTLKIALSKGLTTAQKLLQVAIVWVVPVFGVLLVYLVHRSDDEPKGPAEPPFGGGANDGMPGGVQDTSAGHH